MDSIWQSFQIVRKLKLKGRIMRVLFYLGIKLGKIPCKILGSHSIFAEDSNLLIYYTMLVAK